MLIKINAGNSETSLNVQPNLSPGAKSGSNESLNSTQLLAGFVFPGFPKNPFQ